MNIQTHSFNQLKTSIKLSPSGGIYSGVSGLTTFVTQFNKLNKKLDVHNYLPKFNKNLRIINKSKFNTVKLGEIASFIKRGKTPTYSKEGIPVVKINSIQNGKLSKLTQFVSKDFFQKNKNANILKDDLVLASTGQGSIGKIAIYSSNKLALADNHISIIRLNKQKVNVHYAYTFLTSLFGLLQIEQAITGSTGQTELYPSDIKDIIILLPDKATQNQIADIIQEAYLAKEKKLKQANELLNSIDGYIRKQLGIDYKEPEEEKIYTVNSEDLENNRQDPYYYNPKFVKILISASKGLKTLSLLKVSEVIFNGKTPAKDQYTTTGTPIVKVSCLKNNRIDWSNISYTQNDIQTNKLLRDNDILFLSSAHQAEYLGKNPCIVEIPNDLRKQKVTFVGEIICIRPNVELVNPYYLLAVLKLKEYYLLINREKRGQTSHIYPNDLRKIQVPIIGRKKQDDIAREFKNRLNLATKLKKDALKAVEHAKKKVEEMILN